MAAYGRIWTKNQGDYRCLVARLLEQWKGNVNKVSHVLPPLAPSCADVQLTLTCKIGTFVDLLNRTPVFSD